LFEDLLTDDLLGRPLLLRPAADHHLQLVQLVQLVQPVLPVLLPGVEVMNPLMISLNKIILVSITCSTVALSTLSLAPTLSPLA